MYRRIELIHKNNTTPELLAKFASMGIKELPYEKMGIMSARHEEITDAWIFDLNGPRCSFNSRFYFTEEGWRKVGRKVIAACQRAGQEYRVIAVKENAVDVVFRNEFEIAAQPIRKWRKAGARRGKYLP